MAYSIGCILSNKKQILVSHDMFYLFIGFHLEAFGQVEIHSLTIPKETER